MRIERHQDAGVLISLIDSEGWTRAPGELERRMRIAPAAHYAAREDDGALLGGASTVLYQDAGEGRVAWVSGMVVLPPARGRGLSRALLGEALEYAEREGADAVGLDATAPAKPLYESAGFVPLAETPRWRRAPDEARPVPPTSPTSSIYPISSCEVMELHAYDAPRFGAGRGPVLAELIGSFPERSFVAFDRRSGAVTGFALAQERYIGPLVADSPDIAARLLYACERAGTPPLVHTLDANPHAEKVLREAGYAPDGATCTRMVRRAGGDARLPGRPETVYAIGAWALG